jgi:hypothetical protein
MIQTKLPNKRTGIILFAVIVSIILYLAGVYSGLYANKLIRKETEEGIRSLREETEQDLEALQSYVSFLGTNLKNMQLEQTFIQTLDHEQMCNFSIISFNELINQLRFYWARLPFRIEEYERNNPLSEEYLLLKQQYAHLSIKTWILAKNQYDKCNMDIVHGLYFYSANCENCVEQGEQLDELNKRVRATGRDMIMFPIDFDSNETIIKNLKKYYNINSTPAIMINDNVLQGRVFTTEELTPYAEQKKNV